MAYHRIKKISALIPAVMFQVAVAAQWVAAQPPPPPGSPDVPAGGSMAQAAVIAAVAAFGAWRLLRKK